MAQYPPPPVGPPYAGPPRRRRPRVLWFWVGGALLLLAPVLFVASLFLTLSPLAREDATFDVAESPYRVSLPAHEERALFAAPGYSADCSAVDGRGDPVELRPVTGDFTVNEWVAVSRFDTSDGDLTFECTGTSDGARVRIGQVPSLAGFVGGLFLGLVVPLLLGVAGLVMLVVTAVLYATGAPRNPGSAPR